MQMTLRSWIIKETPHKVAKLLGVNVQSVYYWRDGTYLPSAGYLVQINRITKNRLTYKEMIETYVSNKSK